MVDMGALERQLADESLRIVGPARTVDDLAVYQGIVATQSRRWRYPSMFGAMKYVVAGAIVALFGGVLVAGVLTPKPTEPQPAAVAASPTVGPVPTDGPTFEPDPTAATEEQAVDETRDILPGVDLATEEVEPGVLQVLNDGLRDLNVMLTPEPERRSSTEDARRAATNLIAGLDGSLWILGPDESYRVGHPESYPVTDDTPSFPWQKAEVDPDGRLWTSVDAADAERAELSTLRSFDGERWTTERQDVVAFALEQDGTVWVNADGRFIRLRDGWQTPQMGTEVSDFWLSPVMHGTQVPGDEIEALVESHESCLECGLTTWLLQEDGDTHGGPAGLLPAQLERVDMGAQGDHWIYQRLDVPRAGPGVTDTVAPSDTIEYLVHVTGPTFTVYRGPDDVPALGYGPGGGVFRAGPDGSVWMTPQSRSGCGGLANFDGETWVGYLEGRCVYGFDIATDGTVWVQAGDAPWSEAREEPEPFRVDTFVIRPQVAAPTRS